eukprot:Blabericola_migrator_1__9323@NODE_5010_length_904_cov_60_467145_g3156_i0_p1_GENE_NODE_5010_length_904_cov_60_467145_g3156_i0NODE_5010_length_904_cov_60_467145_g3156_i0_p1_ORF_typecomplete_len113_score9_13_NODE_5010_length_904_cov_60_467145_g3156_i0259597
MTARGHLTTYLDDTLRARELFLYPLILLREFRITRRRLCRSALKQDCGAAKQKILWLAVEWGKFHWTPLILQWWTIQNGTTSVLLTQETSTIRVHEQEEITWHLLQGKKRCG